MICSLTHQQTKKHDYTVATLPSKFWLLYPAPNSAEQTDQQAVSTVVILSRTWA